jgi:cytochrome c biogenesis protein CcmG, thiol:disulfide interchange protein DsbE
MTRRRALLVVVAGVVVIVVVAGALVARGDGEPAVVTSDSATPAPELSGVDPITGKRVRLSSFEGRPVVINVWASWCPPCHDEAPDLARFGREHPEAQLLGVDIKDAEGPARAFYRRYGWRHPSIFDPSGEKAASLGLQGQPITYFLNEQHEIVETIVGPSDFAGFEAGLERAKDAR